MALRFAIYMKADDDVLAMSVFLFFAYYLLLSMSLVIKERTARRVGIAHFPHAYHEPFSAAERSMPSALACARHTMPRSMIFLQAAEWQCRYSFHYRAWLAARRHITRRAPKMARYLLIDTPLDAHIFDAIAGGRLHAMVRKKNTVSHRSLPVSPRDLSPRCRSFHSRPCRKSPAVSYITASELTMRA